MERDHPLALELASLRGAVSKYQHASHQSGIQLQGSRLEYTLLAEKVKGLETENTRLHTEVDVLRSNPPIISPTPDSLALKQLTLAHRKLSALLTSTEQALAEKTTDLVNCQAELARTIMDRNLCRKAEDETRMMWNDMDDKIDAEKDLRWKVQVDRDLCNSIIEQYQKLYPAFVPVVPPPKPWHDPPPPTPPKDLDAIPTRSIPDLFAGRPGLEKLLSDFHAETKVLKTELREAKMLAAEAAKKLVLEEKGAEAERVLRADAINELDRKSRDDRAAAGMVERYMAFSQTSSLALHSSLQNLRIRHTATLATLNAQIIELQRMFGEEQARGQALLRSLGTLGEEVGRESAGRRREIGLRLAALGREERILETVRRWEEKARNALRRSTVPVDGEPSPSSQPPSPDPTTTTLIQLINDASNLVSTISSDEDLSSSAAKILLAEDLAAGLIEELRAETETRVALERERRELLGDASIRSASVTAASKLPMVPQATAEKDAVLIDVSTTEEKEKDLPPLNLNGTNTQQERLLITSIFTSPTTSLPPLPTPVPSDTPLLHSLKPIASLHLALQHSFHTLHQSLLSLQSTLSSPSPDPPIPHQPILLSAVERLMDISEDARVELEIHVDDEVRVAGGFVAILEVGGTGKVEEEALAFVEGRRGRNKVGDVFRRRLEDLEYDAAALKSALYPAFHPSSSSSSSVPNSPPPSSPTSAYNLPSPSLFGPSKPSTYINPLTALNLRNAMPYFSPPPNANNNPSPTSPLSSFRRPSFANIGRLFSDGSGGASIGVQHHSGASPKGAGGTGARGVGMMYKEARRSSSALGLRGMAGLTGAGGGAVSGSAGPSSPMGRDRDVEAGAGAGAGKQETEEEKEELLVDEEEEDESSGDEVE